MFQYIPLMAALLAVNGCVPLPRHGNAAFDGIRFALAESRARYAYTVYEYTYIFSRHINGRTDGGNRRKTAVERIYMLEFDLLNGRHTRYEPFFIQLE